MSRIHEALKKAEGQRPPTWRIPEPGPLNFGGGDSALGTAEGLQSRRPEEIQTSSHCVRLEELHSRCVKPGWKLKPENDVFSSRQSSAVCAEQFRTLRSRLYRLREKNPVRSLLITSTLPGEGKTFVALNLALAIARQYERRVLLIDADLRASKLHVRLGAPSAPGLSDYLNGRADEFSIIQADPKVEFFLVPAGRSVSNPSELLANGMFKGFLDRVTPAFDWVIVDAPPVLAVADAGIIAEFCDGVMVVVRAGETAHDLVKTTLQEFHGNNLLGVVLNDVDEKTDYGGYSYYAGFGMDKE
jgi:protein-tyrosine kinase